MSNLTRLLLAAAAVVAVAVVGYNLLPGNGGVGGSGNAPTPSPTQVPTPTPAPVALPAAGPLAPGAYFLTDRSLIQASRLTLTVPSGWSIPTKTDAIVIKNEGQPGEVMFTTWIVSHVFSDACQWSEASLVSAGTTIDQFVRVLVNQKSRQASTPSDTTVGGFPTKRVELAVSPKLDVHTCTNGNLRYWPGAGPDLGSGLCCNPAGNIDAVYAVNVAGNRLVVVARHYPDSSPADQAELQSIVDSLQIVP